MRTYSKSIVAEALKIRLPDTLLRPARSAYNTVNHLPNASGTIGAMASRARKSKERFDKESVVTPAAARDHRFARQFRRDPPPLVSLTSIDQG